MNLTKIGNLEAIALLLIVSTNHLLLNMPQTIIDTCGSASLLNIIYSTILVFIIAYILLFLLFKNFPSYDILDISNYLGGKILKNAIGIICAIYLLSVSSVFLRNFAEGLKLIYFFDAPIIYILLFFLFSLPQPFCSMKAKTPSIKNPNSPTIKFRRLFLFSNDDIK